SRGVVPASGSCSRTLPAEPALQRSRSALASGPSSYLPRPLSIDHFAGTACKAHLAITVHLVSNARRRPVARVRNSDVRHVDRRLDAVNSALAAGARTNMLRHHVDALNHDALFLRKGPQHFAGTPLVLPSQDDHPVALTDLHALRHHNTSGAREMIFMNFLARSSRVTGPKIRVPIGSP